MRKRRNLQRRGRGSTGGGDWEAVSSQWPYIPGGALATGNFDRKNIIGLVPVNFTATGPFPVGRVLVHDVDITMCIVGQNNAGPAVIFYGMGLYVSDYDDASGTFALQHPLQPTDACRDNWLDLKVGSIQFPGAALQTAQMGVTHHISLKRPVVIEQGQMLQFVFDNSVSSGGGYFYTCYARVKITKVV